NAGQVAGFRAAEYIANRCADWSLDRRAAGRGIRSAAAALFDWCDSARISTTSWRKERDALQERMSRAGAHIRSLAEIGTAVEEAHAQWRRISAEACGFSGPGDLKEALCTRQLCFAHLVYLEAIRAALESGVGSRGSAVVLDPAGAAVHPKLDDFWRIAPEDESFREKVLETQANVSGECSSNWLPRRGVPESDTWFETAWAKFRDGEIYSPRG
ncbi:MAG: hypothetical protein ACYTGB_16385, partial [Planctomycetota bacterium]